MKERVITLYRSVGRSQLADAGHYLVGTLLCHLSSAAFAPLADRLPLVPNAWHSLDVRVHRYDPDRRQPEIPPARQRRSQMHRGMSRLINNPGQLSLAIRSWW